MSSKARRPRLVAVASLFVLVAALLVVPVATGQLASADTTEPVTVQNPNVCGPLDSGKIDMHGNHPYVDYTAPPGYLVAGYCVKAGSVQQEHGPEYHEVDPPQKTVTITHSSGKDVSHYSVKWVPEPVETTEPETTEPETTEPETTEPTTTEPETTEPTTTEPETTEPTTTEPTTTEPTTTEPTTTQPGTTQPDTTEPATTQPTTQPLPTDPATTPPTTGGVAPGGGTVAPSPAPASTLAPPLGQLAETGTSTAPIAAIAGALLLSGGLALLAVRRPSTR